jgi:hypothetical protein
MSIKDCRPTGPKSAENFTANARHTGHTNEEILLMNTLRPSAPSLSYNQPCPMARSKGCALRVQDRLSAKGFSAGDLAW